MISDTFKEVLQEVGKHLGRHRIDVPGARLSGVEWEAAWDHSGRILDLGVTLPLAAFHQNLQTDLPAAPSFLLCLAYWMERLPAREGCVVRCTCSIDSAGWTGPSLPSTKTDRHIWRSLFLVKELERLFPDRLICNYPGGVPPWRWPTQPRFNSPGNRPGPQGDQQLPIRVREADMELHMAGNATVIAAFPVQGPDAPTEMSRQLPVGLFEGPVARHTAVSPGGKSQVDLWCFSRDRRVLHLFELKIDGNQKVGIIPEALYYARLIGYARTGFPCPWGASILQDERNGKAPADLSTVQRIVMWLTAPDFHPLVWSAAGTPLEWFNQALQPSAIEFRIAKYLPVQPAVPGASSSVHWDATWP